MRYREQKNQLLMIVLGVVFFIGVIYENIMGSLQLFTMDENIRSTKEYLYYIVQMRLPLIIGSALLCNSKCKKLVILFIMGCYSFFTGKVFAAAILSQGIKGVLFGIAAGVPHMIFYAAAFWLIGFQKIKRKHIVWILLLILLGILSEAYLNPQILAKMLWQI